MQKKIEICRKIVKNTKMPLGRPVFLVYKTIKFLSENLFLELKRPSDSDELGLESVRCLGFEILAIKSGKIT